MQHKSDSHVGCHRHTGAMLTTVHLIATGGCVGGHIVGRNMPINVVPHIFSYAQVKFLAYSRCQVWHSLIQSGYTYIDTYQASSQKAK